MSTLFVTSHPPGGFGVSGESGRPARTARNRATGAGIRVAASWVPEFRAGADFKALVNGDKATQEKKPAAKPPGRGSRQRDTAVTNGRRHGNGPLVPPRVI